MPALPAVESMITIENGVTHLHLKLEGEPVAQGRPRARLFRVLKKFKIVMYDPNKSYKEGLKKAVEKSLLELGCAIPFFGDQKVHTKFIFKVTRDNKDIDNLQKLMLDVLSKFAFQDDINVVEMSAKKAIADTGSVSVIINTVNHN